jgi:hypothetical protein
MIRIPLRTARGSWKIDSNLSCVKIKLIPNIKVILFLDLEMLTKVILALESFKEILNVQARTLLVILERFNSLN